MNDPGDPLSLLNNDGNDMVEMSLLEEEKKHRKTTPIKVAAELFSCCSVHCCLFWSDALIR